MMTREGNAASEALFFPSQSSWMLRWYVLAARLCQLQKGRAD